MKCTIIVFVFVPVFLYAVTMLIFQTKRIISSGKWSYYVVTFFVCVKMPKIWVGQTMLNREKKRERMALHVTDTAQTCQ